MFFSSTTTNMRMAKEFAPRLRSRASHAAKFTQRPAADSFRARKNASPGRLRLANYESAKGKVELWFLSELCMLLNGRHLWVVTCAWHRTCSLSRQYGEPPFDATAVSDRHPA